jgi:RNase P protein component
LSQNGILQFVVLPKEGLSHMQQKSTKKQMKQMLERQEKLNLKEMKQLGE